MAIKTLSDKVKVVKPKIVLQDKILVPTIRTIYCFCDECNTERVHKINDNNVYCISCNTVLTKYEKQND